MTAPDLLTFCNKTTQRPISIQYEVQPEEVDSPDGSQQETGAGAGAAVSQSQTGGGAVAVQAAAAAVQAEARAAVQVPSRHILVPFVPPPPPEPSIEERWREYALIGDPELADK
jgi:hypothetical protein